MQPKLNNYQYVTNNESLFLNDRIIFIQKNTGNIYKQVIIIKAKPCYLFTSEIYFSSITHFNFIRSTMGSSCRAPKTEQF